jgi:hypothetical protein
MKKIKTQGRLEEELRGTKNQELDDQDHDPREPRGTKS